MNTETERAYQKYIELENGVSLLDLIAAILGSQDAYQTADAILQEYKSLRDIEITPWSILADIPGMTQNRAIRLKAAIEIGRRATTEKNIDRAQIKCPADAATIFCQLLGNAEQEELWVMSLDVKNHVRKVHMLYRGSQMQINIRAAEIFRVPIMIGATQIIIAHNHPSGDVRPSDDDIRVTKLVKSVGDQMDMRLEDHIIVSGKSFYSIREKDPNLW
jgi:DNA repair protein RadC